MQAEVITVGVPIGRVENLEGRAGQVLGGRDAIEEHGLVAGQGGEEIHHGAVATESQEGVVPGAHQVEIGKILDLGKIHHHPVGGIAGLVDDGAGEGDLDGVAVPVQVAALALVVGDTVPGVKLEAAGDEHRSECVEIGVRLYHWAMLTISDHRRDSAGLTYVYPVVSRRAGGVSLGINLNVNNACNWACCYCQVDNLSRGGPPPIDLKRLGEELDGFLDDLVHGDFMTRQVPAEMRRLVDVAFSGNGEPTSAAEFPECVAIVRRVLARYAMDRQVKIRLITNGSLLHRQAVRAGIAAIGAAGGEVWFKVDRVGEEVCRRVNGVPMQPAVVLRNLVACCELAPTWVQTCWFAWDGAAPSVVEEEAYCTLLGQAAERLAGVHLYGLARPSLQPDAGRLGRLAGEELERFAARLHEKTGIRAQISP